MINFTTDLLNINPAYNDSIIKYQSSITGMTKSTITVSGITDPFTVYPYNEKFGYNLKDIAKTLINKNGFEDKVIPNVNLDFIYSDPTLSITIPVQISTSNSITADTITKQYKFIKSVEQLNGYHKKLQFNNDVRLLLPTKNNFDYSVTYFEGFPFDFSIYGINANDTFHFRNTNTGMNSNTFSATTTSVKRIFLSDGVTNETISDILIMSSNVNHLELYVNGTLKANLNIKRVESKCGVYLKWFSSWGGYSYWLFDSVFKDSIKTKELGEVATSWDNLQNKTSTSYSLGKTATQSYQLSTNFDDLEKDYLIDIKKSPLIQMDINHVPFMAHDLYSFIGVSASDSNDPTDNKTRMNKLRLTIDLPELKTITY